MAIDKYIQEGVPKNLMDNTLIYVPIVSLGSGNTGSSALMPILEEAIKRSDSMLTIPLIIQSTEADLAPKPANQSHLVESG